MTCPRRPGTPLGSLQDLPKTLQGRPYPLPPSKTSPRPPKTLQSRPKTPQDLPMVAPGSPNMAQHSLKQTPGSPNMAGTKKG